MSNLLRRVLDVERRIELLAIPAMEERNRRLLQLIRSIDSEGGKPEVIPPPPPPPDNPPNVTITVHGCFGIPIAGATVTSFDADGDEFDSTTTDSSGLADIAVPDPDGGDIEATADRFSTGTAFSVLPGDDQTISLAADTAHGYVCTLSCPIPGHGPPTITSQYGTVTMSGAAPWTATQAGGGGTISWSLIAAGTLSGTYTPGTIISNKSPASHTCGPPAGTYDFTGTAFGNAAFPVGSKIVTTNFT